MIFNLSPSAVDSVAGNSFQAVKSTVGTSATKIDLPESASEVVIRHMTEGTTLWIGNDTTITDDGSTVFPLEKGDSLTLFLKKGNNNNLYGIVSSGSISVYAAGVVTE